MRTIIRLLLVASLGVAAAVLVSCGSSGKGLIPTANGTALQSDFESVSREASAGSGSCATTESALGKTEQDFLALPASIDRGLHKSLEEGIRNLRRRALEMCSQLTSTTSSTASTETTSTTTTPTSTETTPTTTPSTTTTTPTSTTTTPTTTTPANPGGGTEAPGEGASERGAEEGAGKGNGNGNAGGADNPGGASPGGGQ